MPSAEPMRAVADDPAITWVDDPATAAGRDAIVLVPSLGTSSRLFDSLVASLARAGSHLTPLRVDIPGHGRGPRRSTVAVTDIARDLAHGITASEARSVVVVGVSLGGAVALEVARLDPARLRGFAMINSGIRFGSSAGWRALVETASRDGVVGLRGGSASGWFSPSFAGSTAAQALLDELSDIDPASYIACCRALDEYRGHEGIAGITTPSLLVGTSDDTATPAEGLRGLATLLPRASYHELPTGRHLSLVEHSDAVAGLLLGWTGSLA